MLPNYIRTSSFNNETINYQSDTGNDLVNFKDITDCSGMIEEESSNLEAGSELLEIDEDRRI